MSLWELLVTITPAVASALGAGLGLVSFTRPNAHPKATVFIIAIFLLTSFFTSDNLTSSSTFNDNFTRFQLVGLGHIAYLHLYLSASEFSNSGGSLDEIKHHGSPKSDPRNWRFGYNLLCNPRCNLKPIRQIILARRKQDRVQSGKPHDRDYSGKDAQSGTQTPQSRASFIAWRLLGLLGRYIILCIWFDPLLDLESFSSSGAPWNITDYAPERRLLFRKVPCLMGLCRTDTEVVTRQGLLALNNLALVVVNCLTLDSYYDVLTIISVSLNLDPPEDWPPLFGDIREAYSVRRFWGRYWHRLIYHSFSAFGGSISTRLFAFKKGGQAARYASNALVFVLSGVMHWFVEYSELGECSDLGQIYYFTLHFVAIAAEEMFQMALRAVEMRVSTDANGHAWWRALKRIVGYVWVASVFMYAEEKFGYPTYYCLYGGVDEIAI
ncbi:Acetyltransferase aurG [Cladobotryum mycophilum]|uniref:Acetyltransferase aurG n=1 Tax=Cladobotryum mycophilum TaxID=491253 RepID=A0ABR0T4L9_9HYPO